MKNLAFLFLFSILLFQCKPIDVGQKPEKVKPGETFTLKKGVPVKITGINDPLTLELNTVTDSRCPANAVCVWLGFAKVSLSVANAVEQLQDVQLCIGDCRPDPVRSKHEMEILVGNSKYKLILKEVLPYPGTEEEGQEKTVRMAVEVL